MGTSKRELRTVTVKKVHKNKAILKGGYRWTITKKMFNDEWFATKNECYGKALNHHESELSIQKENVKIFKKEVKYLENKLLELE